MTIEQLRETAGAMASSEDKLTAIRNKVSELRDTELSKAEVEERLKEINVRINALKWNELPDLMDQAQVTDISIGADGNKPAITIKVSDNYKANIPDEHRDAAFEYLDSVDAGDLIKYQFTVSFGRGNERTAKKFEELLVRMGVEYDKKLTVPWNTLTAWFREEYKTKPLSHKAMEILGASVRRVADVVKQRKAK